MTTTTNNLTSRTQNLTVKNFTPLKNGPNGWDIISNGPMTSIWNQLYPGRLYQQTIDGRRKNPRVRQDFILGAGPSAIETITEGEFNTEDPDSINTEKLIQLFKDYYMPKRNTYHGRGDFFWAEQETPEEIWRKVVSLEKKCDFKDIKQQDLLISEIITSITNKNYGKNLSVKRP